MTLEERNKKVEDNLGLVTFCLQKLGLTFNEDYFQQGVLELIRCVDNFDETKGRKFSTYAVKNIKFYLKEYIARDKVLKPKRMNGTAKVWAPPVVSTEDIIYDEGGAPITVLDIITKDESGREELNDLMIELDIMVENGYISRRNLDIFLMIHRDGYNQFQVAKKYKLSQAEISRIVKSVTETIRNNLSYNDYSGR